MPFGRQLRQLGDALIFPLSELLRSEHDLLLESKWVAVTSISKNPLNRFGAKFFSQSDEDGITLEIIKRLGLERGAFLELGVGNGLENKTCRKTSMTYLSIDGTNCPSGSDMRLHRKRLSKFCYAVVPYDHKVSGQLALEAMIFC